MKGRKVSGFECRINVNSHKVTYSKPSSKQPPTHKKPRRQSYQHVRLEYITVADDSDESQINSRRLKSPTARQVKNRKKCKPSTSKPKSPTPQLNRSRISELKQKEINMLHLEKQQKRNKVALQKQKESRQLKELIELGNREKKILLELYNLRVRQRNESKSLSPRSCVSQRLSWGANEKRINQYATQTLKRICWSMRSMKARSASLCVPESGSPRKRKSKYSRKRQEKSPSPKIQERPPKRRVIEINRGDSFKNPDEEDFEQLQRKQMQQLLNIKAIKIQRFYRQRRRRKQMLQLLHVLYRPKPPKTSTAINTDPMLPILPPILPPGQTIASLRTKQLKLIQQKYELLVQTRQTQQLQMQYVLERQSGTATNLHVINENIICLIKYLMMYYEDELMEEIKEPYGSKAIERIRALNGYDMDEYDPYTISEEIFTEFEQNVIDSLECSNPESKIYEHTHNKALFDAFNEAINRRRNYYDIEGQPFPWTHNTRTLKQPSSCTPILKSLLDLCLQQILRDSRTLAGLHIDECQTPLTHLDFDNYIQSPLHPNPYVANIRDQRISRLITAQLQQQEPSWFWVENEKAEIMFTLSEDIFDLVCSEMVRTLAAFSFRR